jgi:hypothetical protein
LQVDLQNGCAATRLITDYKQWLAIGRGVGRYEEDALWASIANGTAPRIVVSYKSCSLWISNVVDHNPTDALKADECELLTPKATDHYALWLWTLVGASCIKRVIVIARIK